MESAILPPLGNTSAGAVVRQLSGEESPTTLFRKIRELRNQQEVYKKDKDKKPEHIEKKLDKFNNSIFGRVARSSYFEQMTIVIIVFNAVEIGVDADYSARWVRSDNLFEGPVGFMLCEVFFCAYFTLEICIRFLGFRRKCQSLHDGWFIFDSLLVSLMITETVVLPFLGSGGKMGRLAILRLLRLLRISRMAKLMRAFPQLLMIVRGINAAMRAVSWTALLLVLVTVTAAVIFTNMYHQGDLTDAEVEEEGDQVTMFFGSMGKSMLSLLVMGTILDDVTACTDAIRASGSVSMLTCFLLYILLNSFTMMNMLVGILVEVVGNTAEAEKKAAVETNVRESVRTVFEQMDADGSGRISRAEFLSMKSDRKVMKALDHLDIHEKHFDHYVDLLFQPQHELDIGDEDEGPTLSFEELLDCILRLRPRARISSLDFASFKQAILSSMSVSRDRISRIEGLLTRMAQIPFESDDDDLSSRCSFMSPASEVTTVNSPIRPSPITASMVADLEQTSSPDILAELTRRLGVVCFEESGVPVALLDGDFQKQLKAQLAQAGSDTASTNPATSLLS